MDDGWMYGQMGRWSMDGWWMDVDPDHMWNPSEQDEEHPPFHQAQEADHRWRISRERHRLVVQVLRICGETGSRDGWVWFYLLWLWLLNRDEDAWTVFVFQVKQKDGSPFPHLFEKSKNSCCTMLFIKVFKWKIYLPMEINCRLKYSHSERQLTSSNFKSMFGILLWSRRCSLIFSCCMIRTLSSLQTPDWLISVYRVSLNHLKFWPTLETGNHKHISAPKNVFISLEKKVRNKMFWAWPFKRHFTSGDKEWMCQQWTGPAGSQTTLVDLTHTHCCALQLQRTRACSAME